MNFVVLVNQSRLQHLNKSSEEPNGLKCYKLCFEKVQITILPQLP